MARASLVVLVLSLVLPPSLAAQGGATREQAKTALKEFRSYFSHRNPHVRKAAVDGLRGVDHRLVMEALLGVLKDPDPRVREAAVAALATQTARDSVSLMIQQMWYGRNKRRRLAILKAFRTSRPPVAWSGGADLVGSRDWEIREAAVALLGVYPDQEGKGLGAVLPLLEDREALVRLAAVDALRALGNPRGQAGALGRLADPDWRVRAAAIKVLRDFRKKSSIQALIDLMRRDKGRLEDDARDALEDLTGFDYPADPERWQKWWDRVQDGFRVPTRKEIEARARKEERSREGYAKPRRGGYPPYHGIKTRSRRMIFVLDISSSMAEKVVLDHRDKRAMEEFRKRYGDTENRVKIDLAREELINVVAGLKPYVRFNIITFNAKIYRWQKRLVPASGGNKNKAIKYLARLTVARLVPSGGMKVAAIPGQTNTYEALNACFGLVEGMTARRRKGHRAEADTVFLLSDGNPTIGGIVEPGPLLDYFTAMNRRARLVFHTIGFGNANKPLLEAIALRSGGQYVCIGQ